jgi:hypothetical protein
MLGKSSDNRFIKEFILKLDINLFPAPKLIATSATVLGLLPIIYNYETVEDKLTRR